jgi:hypothetical protein
MKRYIELQQISAEQFRRLTGIKRNTFEEAVRILSEEESKKGKYRNSGRKSCLSVEDKLLMALEYLREYRTYFHLGRSYRLSESACYRSCRWVEDTLIKSRKFTLPGKKALLGNKEEYEIILIDATETPIERPKKSPWKKADKESQ